MRLELGDFCTLLNCNHELNVMIKYKLHLI